MKKVLKQSLKNINWKQAAKVVGVSALLWTPAALAMALPRPTCPTGINCTTESNLNNFIIKIINYILAVTLAIDILFLIIGGFFYITSAGNGDQAKKGKQTVINAVIGLIVIMLAYVIANVVSSFFEDFQ